MSKVPVVLFFDAAEFAWANYFETSNKDNLAPRRVRTECNNNNKKAGIMVH